jgi:hypothetical protein
MRRLLNAALCSALLLLSASYAGGRSTTPLTGIVRDPSDALIPNGQVTITNFATNVVTKVPTNDERTRLALNLLR